MRLLTSIPKDGGPPTETANWPATRKGCGGWTTASTPAALWLGRGRGRRCSAPLRFCRGRLTSRSVCRILAKASRNTIDNVVLRCQAASDILIQQQRLLPKVRQTQAKFWEWGLTGAEGICVDCITTS